MARSTAATERDWLSSSAGADVLDGAERVGTVKLPRNRFGTNLRMSLTCDFAQRNAVPPND
ncbi:hypothetical protein Adu01nite_20420 [Paractinoplanes durhamensis]|uniref:Uncharacterized protein n=1 Tax=Paractinoplanes durhamensis TaxID=113563 RepID=A0ABQ3YSX7_9ACTN|nr:hypothetical protein Adu01nite_20420 [Actinoplanes durhamensis]